MQENRDRRCSYKQWDMSGSIFTFAGPSSHWGLQTAVCGWLATSVALLPTEGRTEQDTSRQEDSGPQSWQFTAKWCRSWQREMLCLQSWNNWARMYRLEAVLAPVTMRWWCSGSWKKKTRQKAGSQRGASIELTFTCSETCLEESYVIQYWRKSG